MRRPMVSPFARIVFPVQADERTWQTLDLGAAIARELHAELRAVFLRDADALAAAALPITRTVSFHTGVVGTFDVAMLEAAYRAKASRLRDHVDRICRTASLRWSIEIESSVDLPPGEEEGGAAVPPAIVPHDLLLLDPSLVLRPRLIVNILRLAGRNTLFGIWHRNGEHPAGIVLFSKGEPWPLQAALEFSSALDVRCQVIVYAGAPAEVEERLQAVRRGLGDELERVELNTLFMGQGTRIVDLVNQYKGSLLLFDERELLLLGNA